MNTVDKEVMAKQYRDAESGVMNTSEREVTRLQNAAYAAGLERGQGNINKVIAVFEQVITAIDKWMTGDLTGLDAIIAINEITDAYEDMDALNKELQQ